MVDDFDIAEEPASLEKQVIQNVHLVDDAGSTVGSKLLYSILLYGILQLYQPSNLELHSLDISAIPNCSIGEVVICVQRCGTLYVPPDHPGLAQLECAR